MDTLFTFIKIGTGIAGYNAGYSIGREMVRKWWEDHPAPPPTGGAPPPSPPRGGVRRVTGGDPRFHGPTERGDGGTEHSRHATEADIGNMFGECGVVTNVCEVERAKQVPEVCSTLRKRFFFFPPGFIVRDVWKSVEGMRADEAKKKYIGTLLGKFDGAGTQVNISEWLSKIGPSIQTNLALLGKNLDELVPDISLGINKN